MYCFPNSHSQITAGLAGGPPISVGQNWGDHEDTWREEQSQPEGEIERGMLALLVLFQNRSTTQSFVPLLFGQQTASRRSLQVNG